ncbi:MAG TPA: aminotransferase class III-fold pyridoxal phosphate-dependent enzyme [Candidatus Limnocylindrales bacterium]|nr:aminotransferase class III-fold pyridoxal phosphate-dependent enzyme [Candidatus Limnocylindrales bacterium]
MDRVLAASRPAFDADHVVDIARRTFDIEAAVARDLGSERDQAFMLLDHDDRPLAILKLSNAAEDPATLDMEALAVLHAQRVDPAVPLAIPWIIPNAARRSMDPADRRVAISASDGTHHVRAYSVLPGRGRIEAISLSDTALAGWGAMAARLGRALRGFFHPAAQRTMLWDVQHTARTRELLGSIRDPVHRDLVARVLDRFETAVEPLWPSLRAQVVHTDLTTDNALADDDGNVTGIVDFGDMSHSALIVDLASLLDSLLNGRTDDELFRCARLVVTGYEAITPLEPIELRVLPELLAARAAVTIAISSWRSAQGLEDATFAERYNAPVARTIQTLLDVGWDEAARRFGAPVERPSGGLAARREAVIGPAMEALSYEDPIHVVSASGAWMTGADGRRYLDAYNNVPCVGHGHPRVTEAIARQSRLINTNMRYLYESAIELAERLVATMPPDSGLDTVMFVNSGSEANDVAWRLATTFSGNRGALCTAFAYHGVTEATAALSPESWQAVRPPEHVETWQPPDRLRGRYLDGDAFADAVARLATRGLAPAAAILDGLLTSDGYLDPGPKLAAEWVATTRAAGGLWIADEVQGGHGRTGHHMWSFQHLGITPDIVTIGKPMGNGHPVGAVVTRREIAARFGDETVFFSTFGGNPVSAAAALAVLDVLEDERVLERVVGVGAALREAIAATARPHPAVLDVRGVGLAIGVEVVDRATAATIKEGLRERGVLIGTAGRDGNVLKIRPPLAFSAADTEVFADALAATLGWVGSR